MSPPPFIHLNCHSEYSLIDGLLRITPWVEQVAEQGMPAVALTDHNNLFAAVKFYRAALAAGVKPIIGSDVLLANPSHPNKPFMVTLLCANQQGYQQLTRLLSTAYQQGRQQGMVQVQWSWLVEHAAGLIALSGGIQGEIGQSLLVGDRDAAKEQLARWQRAFPDRFYVELQRIGANNENTYVSAAVNLALAHGVPMVATNAVRFLSPQDFRAHEARVCIHRGNVVDDQQRQKDYTAQQYLRSAEEMQSLFADIPEALTNTVEIAKRCNVQLNLGNVSLPNFPIPEETTIEVHLARLAQQGLDERLPCLFADRLAALDSLRQPYDQRLQLELEVINGMGYAGYFLIVADFIQWAKNNDVPVGPGRGSGAGSLVAYSLKITDLDPLSYDLLFERFLNPERVSMPDFDIDFCMEGRDRVIDYVAKKYGRDSVSQIMTFGSMAAKAVVRDTGRVLGYPYGFVDKIAKKIPFEIGITLSKALQQEEDLAQQYEREEDVKAIIDLAKELEGVTRNVGKHAGGVVIAPSALTDFTALYYEEGSAQAISQFDKDDVEAVGLVKFDFLGLRTLTIIHWALQMINQQRHEQQCPSIDINFISLSDEATFSLLKACQTTAVFQLESRGMKELIQRLQPDCFEDIIALVALFRPGPLQSGMVDDFIDRKHGRAAITYLHPDIAPILKPTYGVILYQEQVMQIAQVLAGYTLGAADLLRRAMGKKKPEEMAKQREIFLSGAMKRGVDKAVATNIFDLMEKFAGYGFNKSHSAAYALLSYQTAWLKAHYPAAFMAAVLSSEMEHIEKIAGFIQDSRQLGLTVLPPAINSSQEKFTVADDKTIVYGLGAIKSVGGAAMEAIRQARQRRGNFTDFFDFCQQVDTRRVNRRVMEALIYSGAMDDLGPHRAAMMRSLDKALKLAEQHHQNQRIGQDDMFAMLLPEGQDAVANQSAFVQAPPWAVDILLQGEKETLGFYLSGHPLDAYQEELHHITTGRIAALKPVRDQSVTIAGYVVAMRSMITKRGDRMAFVSLEDSSGRIDLAIFSDVYETYKHLLVKDNLLVVEGDVSVDNYSGGYRMGARQLLTLEQARHLYGRCLLLNLSADSLTADSLSKLQQVLLRYSGGPMAVVIEYHGKMAKTALKLGKAWQVRVSDALLIDLREAAIQAWVDYSPLA